MYNMDFCVLEIKLCPYLTMRRVAMVTKGQGVVVLKEKRADTWSVICKARQDKDRSLDVIFITQECSFIYSPYLYILVISLHLTDLWWY